VTVVGGLRSRFLHDSLQNAVQDGLQALGWFDPSRAHRPIQFLAEPAEWDREIAANSMVVTTRSQATDWVEVGSLLHTDTVMMGIDIYGESDSFATHISNDVRDLLRGRLPLGPQLGMLPIYDYRMATPAVIGAALIADVVVTRVRPQVNRPHSLFWFGVDVELHDSYYDSGALPPPP
jgi:hypothetical protein